MDDLGVSVEGGSLRAKVPGDEIPQAANGAGDEVGSEGSAGVLSEAELKRFVVSKFHEVVRKHFRGPLKVRNAPYFLS